MSVLGLGCAPMLGRAGRRDSLRALAAAWDAGITFYDTARSYGYGESEALLGEFFDGGRRNQAVICTKFGILPAKKNWKQRVKPLAQAAIKLLPAMRQAVRSQAVGQLIRAEFSVPLLQTSVETSLRKLRTDYVDILLLHAAPLGVLEKDDLLGALQGMVESGKVRMAGISGDADVIATSLERRPKGIATAQFAMNTSDMRLAAVMPNAAREGWFLVANHPFGGPQGVVATRRTIEAIRNDASLDEELRSKLRADSQLMPELILNSILSDTGVHAVIPAMIDTHHLESNVRALESCRFTPSELASLRATLVAGAGSASHLQPV